ncbi:hypothetical protein PSQ19_00850 [Devosia algicola]|uniref:Uncharacterized protein n=1 Tax=Devosia algicola TaxID=3026418 RepID=A0ABY7YNQ2_9HYPH|nr:hypothetical protein [Devosia algicola]WDR02817.1 hypothetical protein PSQ19_00850 [Devosia algicola]
MVLSPDGGFCSLLVAGLSALGTDGVGVAASTAGATDSTADAVAGAAVVSVTVSVAADASAVALGVGVADWAGADVSAVTAGSVGVAVSGGGAVSVGVAVSAGGAVSAVVAGSASTAGAVSAGVGAGAVAGASAAGGCVVAVSAVAVWTGAGLVRPCRMSLASPGALATTKGSVCLSGLITTTNDLSARAVLPVSPSVISTPPAGSGASGTKTQSPLDSTVVLPNRSPLAKTSISDFGVPDPAITTDPSGSARNKPKVAAIRSFGTLGSAVGAGSAGFAVATSAGDEAVASPASGGVTLWSVSPIVVSVGVSGAVWSGSAAVSVTATGTPGIWARKHSPMPSGLLKQFTTVGPVRTPMTMSRVTAAAPMVSARGCFGAESASVASRAKWGDAPEVGALPD